MRQKIGRLIDNKYIQGSFFLTISAMIVNLMNYFFYFISGRLLGPIGFGEISTLLSYIAIFSVPFTVTSTFLIQKISASNNQMNYFYLIERFFWLKIKKYWYFLLPFLLIIPIIPNVTNLSIMSAYFFIPLIFISLISSFYNASLQGLKLFLLYSIITILATLLKLLGAISLLVYNNILTILLFLLLSGFIPAVVCYFVLLGKTKRIITKPIINNRRLIRILVNTQFLSTLCSVISITILGNIDIIFVKKFFSPVESGIYNSWSLFAKIIFFVIGPLLSVSFVFFSSPKQRQSQNQILKISLFLLMIVGIISYIGYISFAKIFIEVLFGNKFLTILPYLGRASIYGSLYTLIAFSNNYFLAKKSIFSLTLIFLLPIYVVALFFIPKQLINVINLNIIFSIFVTVIYLLVYYFSVKPKILYNSLDGK